MNWVKYKWLTIDKDKIVAMWIRSRENRAELIIETEHRDYRVTYDSLEEARKDTGQKIQL